MNPNYIPTYICEAPGTKPHAIKTASPRLAVEEYANAHLPNGKHKVTVRWAQTKKLISTHDILVEGKTELVD